MAKKKFYRPLLYALLKSLHAIFRLLPLDIGHAFAGYAGAFCYKVARRERRRTIEHLSIAFPELPRREIERLGEDVFRNFGFSIAELIFVKKLNARRDRILRIEGRENFDRALAKGRGVVAVACHFGNWELLGGWIASSGYPMSAVARRIYYKKYDDFITRTRASMGLETIYRDEPARNTVRALKSNRIVGIVADQDVDSVEGVFVDFFGKPAFTPTAPVRFAQVTGAAMIPIFLIRESLKSFRLIVGAPIELEATGDREGDLIRNTQKWVRIQQEYIRKYPHLWAWNHRRWKTVPAPPKTEAVSR